MYEYKHLKPQRRTILIKNLMINIFVDSNCLSGIRYERIYNYNVINSIGIRINKTLPQCTHKMDTKGENHKCYDSVLVYNVRLQNRGER